MAKSHYEILGVSPRSTQDEIRSAYRKIVLQHHPDRSSDPASPEIFMQATEAYDVLSDAPRRRQYDETLRLERLRSSTAQNRANQSSRSGQKRTGDQSRQAAPTSSRHSAKGSGGSSSADAGRPTSPPNHEPTVPKSQGIPTKAQYRASTGNAAISLEVTRLTMMFNRGQLLESEKLAHKILSTDPRQPIPYAVLGDLYKHRGQLERAAEQYALAAQMDPANEIYRVRHEELLSAVYPGAWIDSGEGPNPVPILLGVTAIVLLAAAYLAISPERPFAPGLLFIGDWTLGLISCLVVAGLAVGVGLSRARLVERLTLLTKGAVPGSGSQNAVLYLSVVFYWLGAAIYMFRGLSQNGLSSSLSRVYGACTATLLVFCLGLAAGGSASLVEALLWGGGLLFLCSLAGWYIADAFSDAR